MEANNPYQSPNSPVAVAAIEDETYTPRVFALNGRIGRLRYLAYYGAVAALLVAFAVLSVLLGEVTSHTIGVTLTGLSMLAMGIFFIILGIRRLHDLNRSGWLIALLFVPLVNGVLGVYLLFAPGSEGSNDYGPAPTRNGNFVFLGALLVPVLMTIGALNRPMLKPPQSPVAKTATMEETSSVPKAAEPAPSISEPAMPPPEMAAPADMAGPLQMAPAPISPSNAVESEHVNDSASADTEQR